MALELEARYKLTDRLLADSKIDQVVELACGYTTRGLSLCQNNSKMRYFEVDLPDVVNTKTALLNRFTKIPDNLKIFEGNALDFDRFQHLCNLFDTKKPIDLGCGTGNDTLYLTERGFKVIACDYSEVALEKIKSELPKVETKLVDISQPLPFKDNSFDLVIADLSLHYFDEATTKNIMQEIKRILAPHGHLIARVNSTADINHGAGQGRKIEENFYFVEGYNKRFFDIKDAKKFLTKLIFLFAFQKFMKMAER